MQGDDVDYKQLGKKLRETKRRAYDEGLMMSLIERMADLETEVELLRREMNGKDAYNKKLIATMVTAMKRFSKKLKIALPNFIDHTKARKELIINGEDEDK